VPCLGVNVNVNINTHNPHVTRLRAACIEDDVDDVDDPMQTEPRYRALLGNTGRLYLRSTSPSIALYRPRQTCTGYRRAFGTSCGLHGTAKGLSILCRDQESLCP